MPGIVIESCDNRPYGPGQTNYEYDKWRQEEMEGAMKYRKKTIVVDAEQWFKHGDHPAVDYVYGSGDRICEICDAPSNAHGWCKTLEGQHIVCVGDWIITGVKGEHYPCKPDIFELTYEPA